MMKWQEMGTASLEGLGRYACLSAPVVFRQLLNHFIQHVIDAANVFPLVHTQCELQVAMDGLRGNAPLFRPFFGSVKIDSQLGCAYISDLVAGYKFAYIDQVLSRLAFCRFLRPVE